MNMKRITRIIALVLAVLLFLGLVVTPALAAEADSGDTSVGIIGGADGPTSIFVATSPSGIISTLLLIAGAICMAVAIFQKRKK